MSTAACRRACSRPISRAEGLRFSSPIPGFGIPSIVGPFNYFDLRARLTQTVADMTALNNYRSAKETLRANQFFAQDSKDLVVLAVGGAYLQVIAARARVESAKAQLTRPTPSINRPRSSAGSGCSLRSMSTRARFRC